jgi:hypothetical protein
LRNALIQSIPSLTIRARSRVDNASASEAGDRGFESHRARQLYSLDLKDNRPQAIITGTQSDSRLSPRHIPTHQQHPHMRIDGNPRTTTETIRLLTLPHKELLPNSMHITGPHPLLLHDRVILAKNLIRVKNPQNRNPQIRNHNNTSARLIIKLPKTNHTPSHQPTKNASSIRPPLPNANL